MFNCISRNIFQYIFITPKIVLNVIRTHYVHIILNVIKTNEKLKIAIIGWIIFRKIKLLGFWTSEALLFYVLPQK